MNHNTCTCSGCMESRALAAEREVARLTAENARLREDAERLSNWLCEEMDDNYRKGSPRYNEIRAVLRDHDAVMVGHPADKGQQGE